MQEIGQDRAVGDIGRRGHRRMDRLAAARPVLRSAAPANPRRWGCPNPTVNKTPAGTVTTNRELTNAPLVVRSVDDAILATFRRKKPFSDDRATKLGARTRRQIAADKL